MHPNGLPDLFLDRSLGRIRVPRLLRAAGLRLVTLAEHYGVPLDEEIEDTTWLALVGEQGWVALMKDAEIRRRPAERDILVTCSVRAFCLSGGNFRAEEMADRFIRAIPAMVEACRASGPFLYAIHKDRISHIDLQRRARSE